MRRICSLILAAVIICGIFAVTPIGAFAVEEKTKTVEFKSDYGSVNFPLDYLTPEVAEAFPSVMPLEDEEIVKQLENEIASRTDKRIEYKAFDLGFEIEMPEGTTVAFVLGEDFADFTVDVLEFDVINNDIREISEVSVGSDGITEEIPYNGEKIILCSKKVISAYLIEVSVKGEGGYVTPSGKQSVKVGEEAEYYISADEGYVIRKLIIDGEELKKAEGLGKYTYKFTDVQEEHTLEVEFEEENVGVNVTVSEVESKTSDISEKAVAVAAEKEKDGVLILLIILPIIVFVLAISAAVVIVLISRDREKKKRAKQRLEAEKASELLAEEEARMAKETEKRNAEIAALKLSAERAAAERVAKQKAEAAAKAEEERLAAEKQAKENLSEEEKAKMFAEEAAEKEILAQAAAAEASKLAAEALASEVAAKKAMEDAVIEAQSAKEAADSLKALPSDKSKICRQCGTKLSEESAFCHNCGEKQ